jgi:tetratricopeptide (TPR) repeat protein
MPVDYTLCKNEDGSKTIWVGEIERRHRMKWAIGVTLRPDSSVLEVEVKHFNRTPLANSMLDFANIAVHTNEDYQVIFSPTTEFVTQHSKIKFARWPIADNVYRSSDFRAGVDVSMWKNHPAGISMFAWDHEGDFAGGYDHGREAGVVRVGDHHIVTGKKFFTWGRSPRGELWDELLSDEDGPYLELMVGAYSDNQPDYSWTHPCETRLVKHYWYPIRAVGGAKEANPNGVVNLEIDGRRARVGFQTTTRHAMARATVLAGEKLVMDEVTEIGPDKPFTRDLELLAGARTDQVRAALIVDGEVLISYTPAPRKGGPLPQPVSPPTGPQADDSIERLYLQGLWVGQFHNPAVDPKPYYREILKRDPGDYRANTQLGLLLLKAGDFIEAERTLRAAVTRLTHDYVRPETGEAHYYLGVAVDYANAGMLAEAGDLIRRGLDLHEEPSQAHPMLYYFGAHWLERQGESERALEFYRKAASAPSHLVFPFRSEAIAVLKRAMEVNPGDTRAPYYLGNLLFDHQPEAAIEAWEMARSLDPEFAQVHRNLGIGYARTRNRPDEAIASMKTSLQLRADARTLFELDQISEECAVDIEERMATFDRYRQTAFERDDALTRMIDVTVQVGRLDGALDILGSHEFNKWEGVGSLHDSYVLANLLRGHQNYDSGRHEAVLQDYLAAMEYPRNIGEAKRHGDGKLARPAFYVARAHKALGNESEAASHFRLAISEADDALVVVNPGLDEWISILYFKGLALRELGEAEEARKIFTAMVTAGKEYQHGRSQEDVFAKFGERQSQNALLAYAHHLTGLGYLELRKTDQAREEFRTALSLNAGHQQAKWRLSHN